MSEQRCNPFCAVEGCTGADWNNVRVSEAAWSNKTQLDMVREFHIAYGVGAARRPEHPSFATKELRKSLISEEYKEVMDALDMASLVNIAQELADLIYVVQGTALAYGIPLDDVFAEVHRANMSKLGEDGKPIRREDGKVLKGPNYKAPDIKGVLGL